MVERLNLLWDTARQAVENPGANPATAAFVLAAVIIVALMLVMLLLLAITPRKRRVVKVVRRTVATGVASDAVVVEETTESDAAASVSEPVPTFETVEGWVEADEPVADKPSSHKPAPKGPLAAWIAGPFIVPLLVLLAIAVGYVTTGTDAYCAGSCHASNPAVVSAADVDHASCKGCHETPGLSGVGENLISRTRMVVSYVTGDRRADDAIVQSRSCVRCHRDLLDETVQTDRDIRMSHAEPHAAGITCVSCHTTVGHDTRRHYSMSSCVTCHNDETASAECSGCHAGDPYATREESSESTRTMGSGRVVYPVTLVGDRDCSGCHNEEAECDTCHGLRMPHDEQFIEGGHARAGAFDSKEMCFRCHEEIWCSSGCHRGFPGHAGNWKQEHKRSPRDALCGCHASRVDRTVPMCTLCHTW